MNNSDMNNLVIRSEPRQILAVILIATATALGVTLKVPTQIVANDISRWCTVWSLLERGSFAIDDCPWQANTQDKVKKPDKLTEPGPESGPLRKLEYAIVPKAWREGEPTER